MSNEKKGKDDARPRAPKLTPEERSQIARNAARAKWAALGDHSNLPRATHDGKLNLGGIEVPCAVLSDGTRLLTQRGLYGAIGRSGGTGSWQGAPGDAHSLPRFLAPANLKDFISSDLECASRPVPFRPKRGAIAYGYRAEILIDVCHVYLDAKDAGKLSPAQIGIAERCKVLNKALGKIGIISLVDEATGYQNEREQDELHRLLAVYLTEERLRWAQRFPNEFYKQLFRLRGWAWPNNGNRSPFVGKLTNQLVYERLPQGVLDELKKRNPTAPETGRRRWKHHQFLSEDIGQPDLRDHLLQLVAIMRTSRDWQDFFERFDQAFPVPGSQPRLV